PIRIIRGSRRHLKANLVRLHHRTVTTSQPPLHRQLILTGRQWIVPGLSATRRRTISQYEPINQLRFLRVEKHRLRQVLVLADVIAARAQPFIRLPVHVRHVLAVARELRKVLIKIRRYTSGHRCTRSVGHGYRDRNLVAGFVMIRSWTKKTTDTRDGYLDSATVI